MKLYPINLDIENKACVVIGSGNVALRKVKSLLDAKAIVKVIGPQVQSGVRSRESKEKIEWIKRPYQKGDLEGVFLAIAATDDKVVNEQIAEEAKERKVLLNVVDVPKLCDFYVPSVVSRGDLTISISTSGKYPALSKKLRKQLEIQFGPEYDQYLEILGDARNKVIAGFADLNKRKEKLQQIAELPLVELIKEGEVSKAKSEVERVLA